MLVKFNDPVAALFDFLDGFAELSVGKQNRKLLNVFARSTLAAANVEVRGCEKTCQLSSLAKPASDDDFGKEFLDLTVAVKVVKHVDEAMEHIAKYGSRHTEAIVTSDYPKAMRFLREVDAGAVLVNASTRLNDGYQFGLGAEIGISTSRIHARGPMGLEELTCFKFIVMGSGQVRE